MGQLFIRREKSMVGMAVQLHCFVDDQLVCKIKNGDSASCDVPDGVIEFKCRLSGANPMSDTININTSISSPIEIIVKPGAWNPRVTVVNQNAITSTDHNKFSDVYITQAANKSPAVKHYHFYPTLSVGSYFGIDENSCTWAVGKGLIPSFNNSTPHSYDDIVDFELIEDGTSITKGGLGRAAVGGLLFGGVGAIVGGVTGSKKANQKCTSLMIKITVNNMSAPVEYIKIISSTVDKKGFTYKAAFKNAQEIISLLQVICNQRDSTSNSPSEEPQTIIQETSAADEIRKFKALLDDGIITEEEFLEKKKRLLNL